MWRAFVVLLTGCSWMVGAGKPLRLTALPMKDGASCVLEFNRKKIHETRYLNVVIVDSSLNGDSAEGVWREISRLRMSRGSSFLGKVKVSISCGGVQNQVELNRDAGDNFLSLGIPIGSIRVPDGETECQLRVGIDKSDVELSGLLRNSEVVIFSGDGK